MRTQLDREDSMTIQTDADAASKEGQVEENGLLFGVVLNGDGGCRTIGWDEACAWKPGAPGEVMWLHLDRTIEAVEDFLDSTLALSEATLEAMLSNETRPRAFAEPGGLVTILRGINFNPGAEPEDMIAMQIWTDANRVITLRRRRLQTPRDVLAELEGGDGPKTAGDLLTRLVELMVLKMNHAIIDMNEHIDAMEADEDRKDTDAMLDKISEIRRNCLALKRHMSPQHEALVEIQRAAPDWLSKDNRADIRETVDRLRRYLEDLDVSKESALVLQDDINNRAANRMNQTMYMLSIVAAIFLPLGFLTGLLGINVGGMPGVDDSHAFWIAVGLMIGVFVAQLYVFKKLKWL